MKHIRYFLAIALAAFLTAGLSGQSIRFEKTTHNYGTIKEEAGKVKCEFKFTNVGDQNLKIKNVRPSCGCTASDWTKTEVKPGESGFVSAIYHTKGRPGPFNKAITVTTNDPKQPNTILFIKGKVTPREKTKADFYPRKMGNLRMKTNHMAFMEVKRNEVVTDSIGLYNQWDQPMNLSFGNVPKHLSIEAHPETLQPEQEGYLVFTYDATKKNDYGLIFERFYLMTNDDKQPRKLINVSAKLKEDFSQLSEEDMQRAPVSSFNKMKHDFGNVKSGEKATYAFILKNEGENNLHIRKVKASCGCTATQPGKKVLKAGEETEIKVTFNTHGRHGKQHKTITVITNDPKKPEKILHIQANVI